MFRQDIQHLATLLLSIQEELKNHPICGYRFSIAHLVDLWLRRGSPEHRIQSLRTHLNLLNYQEGGYIVFFR